MNAEFLVNELNAAADRGDEHVSLYFERAMTPAGIGNRQDRFRKAEHAAGAYVRVFTEHGTMVFDPASVVAVMAFTPPDDEPSSGVYA